MKRSLVRFRHQALVFVLRTKINSNLLNCCLTFCLWRCDFQRFACLAHPVEHRSCKAKVVSSSLTTSIPVTSHNGKQNLICKAYRYIGVYQSLIYYFTHELVMLWHRYRKVVQFGRTHGSGLWGRRFKSYLSDWVVIGATQLITPYNMVGVDKDKNELIWVWIWRLWNVIKHIYLSLVYNCFDMI